MRHKDKQAPESAEKTVRDIRRATRRQFSAEEKIRIVLEGLRGEESIAELCRKEGITQTLYYRWSKEFLEAGKKRQKVRGWTASLCETGSSATTSMGSRGFPIAGARAARRSSMPPSRPSS